MMRKLHSYWQNKRLERERRVVYNTTGPSESLNPEQFNEKQKELISHLEPSSDHLKEVLGQFLEDDGKLAMQGTVNEVQNIVGTILTAVPVDKRADLDGVIPRDQSGVLALLVDKMDLYTGQEMIEFGRNAERNALRNSPEAKLASRLLATRTRMPKGRVTTMYDRATRTMYRLEQSPPPENVWVAVSGKLNRPTPGAILRASPNWVSPEEARQRQALVTLKKWDQLGRGPMADQYFKTRRFRAQNGIPQAGFKSASQLAYESHIRGALRSGHNVIPSGSNSVYITNDPEELKWRSYMNYGTGYSLSGGGGGGFGGGPSRYVTHRDHPYFAGEQGAYSAGTKAYIDRLGPHHWSSVQKAHQRSGMLDRQPLEKAYHELTTNPIFNKGPDGLQSRANRLLAMKMREALSSNDYKEYRHLLSQYEQVNSILAKRQAAMPMADSAEKVPTGADRIDVSVYDNSGRLMDASLTVTIRDPKDQTYVQIEPRKLDLGLTLDESEWLKDRGIVLVPKRQLEPVPNATIKHPIRTLQIFCTDNNESLHVSDTLRRSWTLGNGDYVVDREKVERDERIKSVLEGPHGTFHRAFFREIRTLTVDLPDGDATVDLKGMKVGDKRIAKDADVVVQRVRSAQPGLFTYAVHAPEGVYTFQFFEHRSGNRARVENIRVGSGQPSQPSQSSDQLVPEQQTEPLPTPSANMDAIATAKQREMVNRYTPAGYTATVSKYSITLRPTAGSGKKEVTIYLNDDRSIDFIQVDGRDSTQDLPEHTVMYNQHVQPDFLQKIVDAANAAPDPNVPAAPAVPPIPAAPRSKGPQNSPNQSNTDVELSDEVRERAGKKAGEINAILQQKGEKRYEARGRLSRRTPDYYKQKGFVVTVSPNDGGWGAKYDVYYSLDGSKVLGIRQHTGAVGRYTKDVSIVADATPQQVADAILVDLKSPSASATPPATPDNPFPPLPPLGDPPTTPATPEETPMSKEEQRALAVITIGNNTAPEGYDATFTSSADHPDTLSYIPKDPDSDLHSVRIALGDDMEILSVEYDNGTLPVRLNIGDIHGKKLDDATAKKALSLVPGLDAAAAQPPATPTTQPPEALDPTVRAKLDQVAARVQPQLTQLNPRKLATDLADTRQVKIEGAQEILNNLNSAIAEANEAGVDMLRLLEYQKKATVLGNAIQVARAEHERLKPADQQREKEEALAKQLQQKAQEVSKILVGRIGELYKFGATTVNQSIVDGPNGEKEFIIRFTGEEHDVVTVRYSADGQNVKKVEFESHNPFDNDIQITLPDNATQNDLVDEIARRLGLEVDLGSGPLLTSNEAENLRRQKLRADLETAVPTEKFKVTGIQTRQGADGREVIVSLEGLEAAISSDIYLDAESGNVTAILINNAAYKKSPVATAKEVQGKRVPVSVSDQLQAAIVVIEEQIAADKERTFNREKVLLDIIDEQYMYKVVSASANDVVEISQAVGVGPKLKIFIDKEEGDVTSCIVENTDGTSEALSVDSVDRDTSFADQIKEVIRVFEKGKEAKAAAEANADIFDTSDDDLFTDGNIPAPSAPVNDVFGSQFDGVDLNTPIDNSNVANDEQNQSPEPADEDQPWEIDENVEELSIAEYTAMLQRKSADVMTALEVKYDTTGVTSGARRSTGNEVWFDKKMDNGNTTTFVIEHKYLTSKVDSVKIMGGDIHTVVADATPEDYAKLIAREFDLPEKEEVANVPAEEVVEQVGPSPDEQSLTPEELAEKRRHADIREAAESAIDTDHYSLAIRTYSEFEDRIILSADEEEIIIDINRQDSQISYLSDNNILVKMGAIDKSLDLSTRIGQGIDAVNAERIAAPIRLATLKTAVESAVDADDYTVIVQREDDSSDYVWLRPKQEGQEGIGMFISVDTGQPQTVSHGGASIRFGNIDDTKQTTENVKFVMNAIQEELAAEPARFEELQSVLSPLFDVSAYDVSINRYSESEDMITIVSKGDSSNAVRIDVDRDSSKVTYVTLNDDTLNLDSIDTNEPLQIQLREALTIAGIAPVSDEDRLNDLEDLAETEPADDEDILGGLEDMAEQN